MTKVKSQNPATTATTGRMTGATRAVRAALPGCGIPKTGHAGGNACLSDGIMGRHHCGHCALLALAPVSLAVAPTCSASVSAIPQLPDYSATLRCQCLRRFKAGALQL